MNDIDFMAHVISEVCNYALKNDLEPNETLRTIAENILALLEIGSFNRWGKDEEELTHD